MHRIYCNKSRLAAISFSRCRSVSPTLKRFFSQYEQEETVSVLSSAFRFEVTAGRGIATEAVTKGRVECIASNLCNLCLMLVTSSAFGYYLQVRNGANCQQAEATRMPKVGQVPFPFAKSVLALSKALLE
jgi:hypothetical protein